MSVDLANRLEMSESKVNPKLLISDYFDWLINRVDIYTEQQLKMFPSKETMKDPNSEQNTVLVWDYLNQTREKMIKKISEAQVDALNKLDAIRKELKKDETAQEIYEKVFATRFLFILQIELKTIRFLLIETYFYINELRMILLRNWLDLKGFIQVGPTILDLDTTKLFNRSFLLDMPSLRVHSLGSYIKQLLSRNPTLSLDTLKNVEMIDQTVTQTDINLAYISLLNWEKRLDINIDADSESELENKEKVDLEDLFINQNKDLESKLYRLSGICHLKEFYCAGCCLQSTSFGYLPCLQALHLIFCDFRDFHQHSFDSLTSLRELHIIQPGNFTHVDLTALVYLKHLYIEKISSSKILEHVNKDSLCHLDVTASFRSETIEMVFQKIRRFDELKTLNFSFIKIDDDFDFAWLSSLTCLKSLAVIRCKIKTIKSSISAENQPGRFPRLEKLDLSSNCIDRVEREVFREFPCLKWLDVRCNNLKSLSDDVFTNLVNLEELCIMSNQLVQVSHVTFTCLTKLRVLNLNNNPHLSIEKSALWQNMKNLKHFSVYCHKR